MIHIRVDHDNTLAGVLEGVRESVVYDCSIYMRLRRVLYRYTGAERAGYEREMDLRLQAANEGNALANEIAEAMAAMEAYREVKAAAVCALREGPHENDCPRGKLCFCWKKYLENGVRLSWHLLTGM